MIETYNDLDELGTVFLKDEKLLFYLQMRNILSDKAQHIDMQELSSLYEFKIQYYTNSTSTEANADKVERKDTGVRRCS